MKKWFLLPVIFLVMGAVCSTVLARPIGVGAFAGFNIPIAQDDAGSGSLLGTRLRIAIAPFLAVEPSLAFFQQGDVSTQVADKEEDLDGGRSTALGVNLIVGSMGPPDGVRIYGVIGLASHAMKQEGREDESRLAINLGPGLEIGVAKKLTLNVEHRLHMISLEGGGARKNLGLSVGLIYNLHN